MMSQIPPQQGFMATASNRKILFAMGLVVLLTVLAYAQVLHNDFIKFDDTVYVTANRMVQQGLTAQGLLWAVTTENAGNWHPLTWLSHMLDVELFALDPVGHHLTNLVLHIANALLLLVLSFSLTGHLGRSLTVALLFALHPLHVESVAWVAERKDVLSAFFWFLTLWAYLEYTRRPCLTLYLTVVTVFSLGLLAKPMLVTLPLVLLLLDYWPLNRTGSNPASAAPGKGVKSLLVEKLPLFGLSVAAAVVGVHAQSSAGSLNSIDAQALFSNAGNALISYVKYLWLLIWPTKLAVFYPFDPAAVTLPKVVGAACLLALLTGLVVWQRAKRPYLLFGWSWYLLTLLPVIGFIRIGSQALADRYTYLPLIGIFFIIAWGGAELAPKLRLGGAKLCALTAVVICVLTLLTRVQVGYWRSNAELFRHTLAVTENNWIAHNNYGVDLMSLRQYTDGIGHFQEAVRINPVYAEAYRNLGDAYLTTGRIVEGIVALEQALRINPQYAKARLSLGYAYLAGGNVDLAYNEYLQLRSIDPPAAEALFDAIGKTASRVASPPKGGSH
jgi:protein O-mannosyl-transferase